MARLRRSTPSNPLSEVSYTPEHLASARPLFPKQIRDRGRRYFDDMRVILDGVGPGGAVFDVEGNGDDYVVFLRAEGLDVSGSTCSCPYPDYCKHIWAALLEAVEQGLPLRSTDPRDAEFEARRPASESRRSWVADLMRESRRNIREPEKTYHLIFRIGITDSYALRPRLHIRPALRYIRKDGREGAISDFRESALLEPHTAREAMLLEACLGREGKRLDLQIGLGYLRGEDGIPAYMDDRRDLVPISLMQIESIVVDFYPELGNDDPVFYPRLTLKTAEGREQAIDPLECILDLRGAEKIISHFSSGTLALVSIENIRETRLLEILVNARRSWEPGDIHVLDDHLPGERLIPGLFSTDVRMRQIVPKMILYISEIRDEKVEALDFDVREAFPDGMNMGPVFHIRGYWELRIEDRDEFKVRANIVMRKLGGVPVGPSSFRVDTSLPDLLASEALSPPILGLPAGEVELRLKKGDTQILPSRKISIEVASGQDWLELKATMDGRPCSFDERALARRMLFDGTSFIILNEKQIEELRRMDSVPRDSSGRARFSPDDIGTVRDFEDLLEDVENARLERTRAVIKRLEKGFKAVEQEPSRLLMAQLREYQKEGLEWLRFLEQFGLGGILADDMGLGKTVQTIALLADALERNEAGPFLVIAPLSTIPNWASEFRRFLPDMGVHVHVGNGRGPLPEAPSGTILTTYQTLQRDIVDFLEVEWRLLCLDESQNIKNSMTKSHKAIRSLPARRVLALSGTPVENSVMELWSIMDIVNPGLLGSRDRFKRRYLKAVNDGDALRLAELRRRSAPFILRRTKELVAADLPPKEEIIRTVELSAPESKFYSRLKRGLREEVARIMADDEAGIAKVNAVLMALLRLRQAAISPALLGEKPETSSKIDEVMYLLETVLAEGHKVLVFSQFVKVLSLLCSRLDEKNIPYAYLDGSLSSKKREEEIRLFKESQDVFLISLKAGGTGLNLTEADYVFVLDPWWNPAVESQAIDRSHRIGQSRPVIAYKFISSGTVEERILELQEKKKRIADDILSFDSSVINRMNTEEILELFG
ncbi:MAG: DEAD/DEAH box helicase [Spirochaetaceae bacterium]|nr:DEAD/DEAH box helicase [Spirochaetaceae bacterium]